MVTNTHRRYVPLAAAVGPGLRPCQLECVPLKYQSSLNHDYSWISYFIFRWCVLAVFFLQETRQVQTEINSQRQPWSSMFARTLNPENCALLIIDMQHRFDPIASSISSRIASLARLCIAKSIPVFMTQHHDDPNRTTELIKFWGEDVRIERGSYDWSFMSDMEPLSLDAVVIDGKTS